jgi:hypothetical protein
MKIERIAIVFASLLAPMGIGIDVSAETSSVSKIRVQPSKPAAQAPARAEPQVPPTTVAPPSPMSVGVAGFPQGNGGDHDPDNNESASNGDGDQ